MATSFARRSTDEISNRSAKPFQHRVIQQIAHRRRRRAKAVGQFAVDLFPLGFAGDAGDPLVGPQAQIFAGDVLRRDANIEPQVERGAQFGLARLRPSCVATARSSIWQYRSKPMALMWPCCSRPSRLPAPRNSRSSAAMRKPAPSSLNSRKRRQAPRGQRRQRHLFGGTSR